jgi:ethanolamine transporter EutH
MADTVLLVLALFGIVGGIDRILGNRFGFGQHFEEGFKLIGTVAFSMVGIYMREINGRDYCCDNSFAHVQLSMGF